MGATSVTGVSGPGSVAGHQKGSEHMSLSVKKLIGPHIVAAGVATLTGVTTLQIEIPAQSEAITNFMVMLTTDHSTLSYISTALAAVASTNTWTFTVTAANGAIVNWMLVRVGV